MKKLIPILLLLAFACKKYETQTNAQTINAITLKVGDSWSYQVTNYPATQTDTAVFTIIAQTSDTAAHIAGSDTIFKTQTTINGIVVDSGTITQIGMWCSLCNYTPITITYHGDNGIQTFAGSGLFDTWELDFPMSSPTTFKSSTQTATVTAAGQTLSIGGHTYTNVYTLTRTLITPGGLITDTILIAPTIGIIKWNNFPLVSYHLL